MPNIVELPTPPTSSAGVPDPVGCWLRGDSRGDHRLREAGFPRAREAGVPGPEQLARKNFCLGSPSAKLGGCFTSCPARFTGKLAVSGGTLSVYSEQPKTLVNRPETPGTLSFLPVNRPETPRTLPFLAVSGIQLARNAGAFNGPETPGKSTGPKRPGLCRFLPFLAFNGPETPGHSTGPKRPGL